MLVRLTLVLSMLAAPVLFAGDGAAGARISPLPAGLSGDSVQSTPPRAVKADAAVAPNATSPHDCGTACWTTGTYRFDPAGNITAMGGETFHYDGAHRLASATLLPPDGATIAAQYTYDAFGNIHAVSLTSSSSGLSSNTFSVDRTTNRLLGNDYDATGNVLRDAATSARMEWDGLGMLARYTGGRRTAYIYTADEERIAIFDLASGGGAMQATWTVRGMDRDVLRVFKSYGGATATDTWEWQTDYVYGPNGKVLANHGGDGIRHFHLDHLGTPRLITDQDAVKVAEHAYSPFGSEITDKSQDAERMKFTGHERDFLSATGMEDLDYMHARFYSPRASRFFSVDPALDIKQALYEPQMWNRYAYVNNNPLLYIDPDGRYRTFYKEKPMTAENLDLDTAPPLIKGVFITQGALVTIGAGGLFVAEGGGLAAGAFKMAPFARGNFIEAALAAAFGGGLPRTFPVIDRFVRGIATSVKSVDLLAKTYQNASRLQSTLKGYVDKLARFNGARLGETIVRGQDITHRVLEVVIQKGAATPQQLEVIRKMTIYAAQNNVSLRVIMIR